VVKLDQVLRERDRLSGSWSTTTNRELWTTAAACGRPEPRTAGPLSDARFQIFRSQQWRVSESHTFSPTVLNVLNFTYNYDYNAEFAYGPRKLELATRVRKHRSHQLSIHWFLGQQRVWSQRDVPGSTWQGDATGVNQTIGDTSRGAKAAITSLSEVIS